MSTSDTFQALRRANPRSEPGFERSVRAADVVRARIVASSEAAPRAALGVRQHVSRSARRGGARRLGLRAAGAALAAGAVVAAFLTMGLPGGGGVESASAVVNHAAAATAESGDHSGTATVEITHNGELWAGTVVRWNDGDLSVADTAPVRAGIPSRELRVVDGMMYGQETDGWVELGSPDSVDPGSGMTPDEYIAATQADVQGTTLRRITTGMTGVTTRSMDDGSTVYTGSVAAGLIATEEGFKEGEHIRVFPFGYVAHDEAADPAAPLDVAITVGADGLIDRLEVAWGGGGSVWTYTVTYSDLGTTEPILAPEGAQPFPRRIPVPPPAGSGEGS
jgi:hypothetical protein